MLNLILSVRLTAVGDYARGFISAVDLSKAEIREGEDFESSLTKINSFVALSHRTPKKSILV